MSTAETAEIGVLFCDVAGSTRLYREVGDAVALRVVDACLDLAAGVVRAGGGRVVKTIGDEFMAVFDDVCATYDAAITIQRRFEEAAPGMEHVAAQRLLLRIGFHFGPAVRTADDYFGTTVNMAARMTSVAKGGQIITTGALTDVLPPARRAATRALVGVHVKDACEDLGVVEVLWHLSTHQTTVFSLPAGPQAVAVPELRLSHRGQRWVFGEGHQSVSLGRDSSNDILVQNEHASRRHATIERRGDKWVLVDHSTNGTFVTRFGAEEYCIRREELVLRDVGTLGMGQSVGQDRGNGLDYALTLDAEGRSAG